MLADGVALRNRCPQGQARCPQGQADPRAAIAGGASGVTMARASARTMQTPRRELSDDRVAVYTEEASRGTDVPLVAVQDAEHVLPFELLARVFQRQPVFSEAGARLRHGHLQRDVLKLKHRTLSQHHGAMDHVLKLTDIAGPVIA